jgi:hypothetical protein
LVLWRLFNCCAALIFYYYTNTLIDASNIGVQLIFYKRLRTNVGENCPKLGEFCPKGFKFKKQAALREHKTASTL